MNCIYPFHLAIPYIYKVRRALGAKPRQLADVAVKTWEIAPGADETIEPVAILPEHIARIRMGPFGESAASVIQRITATQHLSQPTLAYLVDDITLVDNALYSGLYKHDLFRGPGMKAVAAHQPLHYPRAALATNYAGAKWFGHFLTEELSLQELLTGFEEPAVGHQRPIYVHEPGWRHALGVEAGELVPAAHFQHLVILNDIGENPAKRARYAAMRARLARSMAGKQGHERVFLKRPAAGGEKRVLKNEDQIIQRLQSEGFHVVDPTGMSVDQLLANLFHAQTIVSVEGSHAFVGFYLIREGGTILSLNPPDRVGAITSTHALFFGIRGAMSVGEGTTDGFIVHPDDIFRLLEQSARASS